MEPRFAFAAQFWGDSAVVCRAAEDRPGPVVEQQFGEFATWTQANAFAAKLNEGLDLDPLDVRQIVTSSLLATACVIQESLNSRSQWRGSRIEIEARAAQLRFVLSELALALTFCRSASLLSSSPTLRILLNARTALNHSRQFLTFFDGDVHDLEGVAERTEVLNSALENLSPNLCGA